MLLYPRAVALPFLQSLQAPGGWQEIDDLCFRHTLGTMLRLKPSATSKEVELILEYQEVESAAVAEFSFEPALGNVSVSVLLTYLHLDGPITLDAFQSALLQQIGGIASARLRALSHVLAERFGQGLWQYEQNVEWIAPPGSSLFTPSASFPPLYTILKTWHLQSFLGNGTFTTPWSMPLVSFESHHAALTHAEHLTWAYTVLA